MDAFGIVFLFLFGTLTFGAPLLAFLIRSVITGRHYFKAKWPVVAVYYGLAAAHEAARRFGIPVPVPSMLLIVAGPLVGLFLLLGTVRASGDEARGFEVKVSDDKD